MIGIQLFSKYRRCFTIVGGLCLLFISSTASQAPAPYVVVTAEAPGVVLPTATVDFLGFQSFDHVQSNTTFTIKKNDLSGGAGPSGKYCQIHHESSMTVTYSGGEDDELTMFGAYIGALDRGNYFEFHSQKANTVGTPIFTLEGADILRYATTNPEYFGNPATEVKQYTSKAFIYVTVNFYHCSYHTAVLGSRNTRTFSTDNHTWGTLQKQSGTVIPTDTQVVP